jgi:hypothetical protein
MRDVPCKDPSDCGDDSSHDGKAGCDGMGPDPTRAGAGLDPTRAGAGPDPTRAGAEISISSNRDDSDQGNDDIVILESKERVKKEFIPPFKVLVRKRGDEERRLDLYGHWQTTVYEIPPVREGVIPVTYYHITLPYGYLHNVVIDAKLKVASC